MRLAETADLRTLRDVAHACVKAGMAAQAVGRLTSEDRRQAYEAFSLLSLCAGGGEFGPILEAVESHRDLDTRLTCVQLLDGASAPDVCERLRKLEGDAGAPDALRRSVRDAAERLSRAQTVLVG